MPHCPSCNSSAVLYDEIRGERICTRCGLVIVEKMFELGPDWRTEPGAETGRADVTSGVDITQHDLGLGSKFTVSDDLPPSWRARLRRLQLWQRRSRASTYGEKSLRESMLELEKFCEDLGLPKGIRAEVSSLYRKAKVRRLTVGRNTWNVLAALIFITCRQRRVPRTDSEIARVLATRASLQERAALRSLRQLTKFFEKKLKLRVPQPSPQDYIGRFSSKLNLERSIVARAHFICGSLPKRFRSTKSARLLAASAIYIAIREACVGVTLKELSTSASVGISGLSQTAKNVRELSAGRGE